jgi:hypothetical protein
MVVMALPPKPASSQKRRVPGKPGLAATNAPTKYPIKLADAISPALNLERPSPAIITGSMGVYAKRPIPIPTAKPIMPPSTATEVRLSDVVLFVSASCVCRVTQPPPEGGVFTDKHAESCQAFKMMVEDKSDLF